MQDVLLPTLSASVAHTLSTRKSNFILSLPHVVLLLLPPQVPCTIKTTYSCDKVTTEANTMIITTNGVLNAVDSALRITYGPQVGSSAVIYTIACRHMLPCMFLLQTRLASCTKHVRSMPCES
jgi:hypothetical protein